MLSKKISDIILSKLIKQDKNYRIEENLQYIIILIF